MKFILTLSFAYFLSIGNAQTPLIAHKSHSGLSVDFFIDPSSNFGNPPLDRYPIVKSIIQEKFKPLNDSVMIVERTDFDQNVLKIDTLPNKKRYSPIQFKIIYTDSVTRQERQKLHEEELKREQEIIQQEKEQQHFELQQEHLNETPKKKEKKSYLLFLFGITGGGMLMMKLFDRSKPSIA